MKWELGRRSGVEDRRGMGMGQAVGGGGIGLVIIALIAYFFFDVDPRQVLEAGQGAATTEQTGTPGVECPADDTNCQFVDTVHTSANDVWAAIFQSEGVAYRPSKIVIYQQGTPTGCGMGQSAMGPFYCPADEKVYLDLAFFETLDSQLGAPGDFAKAYVIGHEVGHHIQTLTGVSQQVSQRQQNLSESQANALSVRLELQADCYAGVWARLSNNQLNWLESGDVEEGLNAAAAVGDDTLQRASTGRVVPDSFTHGSSDQRMQWFKAGYEAGSPSACDTFGS